MTSKKFNYEYSNLIIRNYVEKRRSKFVQAKCQKKLSIHYFNSKDKKNSVNCFLIKSINSNSKHTKNKINFQDKINFRDKINFQDKINFHDKIDYFIYLKIMFVLILFLVCSLFNVFYSFNLNSSNLDKLDNNVDQNLFNSTNLHSIAERFTLNNSTLFYDLTNRFNQNVKIKKPIYFQFLTNKPNLLKSHRSSLNSEPFRHVHKQLIRHTSKVSINQQITYQNYFQRFMLNHDNAKCNDGTNSGYYFRKGRSSKWIIYLEGGLFCYSKISCHQRWIQMRNLMTSAHWSERKLGN